MRKAGKVVAEVLQVIEAAVKSVITAADLNRAIVDCLIYLQLYKSMLNAIDILL